jgi:glc operon protein GlcG
MTNIRVYLVFCVVALLFAHAGAQVVTRKALTLELAKSIALGAENEARKSNLTVVVTIVDDGANMVYLQRMDNTQIGSIDVAIQKAKTAISFKRPTKVYEDMVAGGRTAILGIPGVIPIEGGLPIVVDGQYIGAIGVSGGTAQQDGLVAAAALQVLNRK